MKMNDNRFVMTRRQAIPMVAVLLSATGLLAKVRERTDLRVVVQDEQGRPVPRASIIIRELKGKNLQKTGHSFELKTSNEGSTPVPPLPRGYVLIQVICKGYQTHGEKIELTEEEQTIVINLKPPVNQFSVHQE